MPAVDGATDSRSAQTLEAGRYAIYGEIASGGMATIQYGRLVGPGGFARGVAIKRLHPQFAKDASFVSMFLDEARLAARIAHANVVPTLDVLSCDHEVAVVMEYVHGETLFGLIAMLQARGEAIPFRMAATLLSGVLHGLHAAHETCGELGEHLHIVHRDVSPQNILVGSDGIARVLDFGIAKAKGQSRATPTGELKGKLAYMACEQYRGEEVDRRVDVYGASVVLWEALTGRVLFDGPNDAAVAGAVLNGDVSAPSELVSNVPEALDAIVMRGLSRDREQRFATAREMALALERDVGIATQSEVSDWVRGVAGELLTMRAEALRQMQQRSEPRERSSAEAGTRRMEIGAVTPVTRSSQSAQTPMPPSRIHGHTGSRSRLTTWLGVIGVLALIAFAALAWRANPAPRAAAPVPNLTKAQHAPTSPASAPIVPVAPIEATTAPVAPTPTAAASEVRVEKPRAADSVKAKPRASKGAINKRGLDCRQPFVVDALGIRRVKRECL